jgi:zeaxanthin glucosyltransferase
MIVVPLTYEQPAIAMRVARIGAGKVVPLSCVSSRRLRTEIGQVSSCSAYTVRAQGMAASIRAAGGVARAAQLIENT